MNTNGQISQSEWVHDALQRFEGSLVRYALRITGNLESAQDVVQETFLRLCREVPESVDGHLSQWLFTVCRNRAIDVQRKEQRMTTSTELDHKNASSSSGPQETAGLGDSSAKVMKMLNDLPDNQQEVIRLKFQNELSYREISEVTGLSVSNVGFLLHVGIKRLRELMKHD